MLVAILQDNRFRRALTPKLVKAPNAHRIAVAITLVAGLAWIPTHTPSAISTGLVAVDAAMLVWLASYDANFFALPRGMQHAALYIGSRSYALYLTHIPAYLLARHMMAHLRSAIPSIFVAAALTIAFTEINHRLVEEPARKFGHRLANRLFVRLRSSHPSRDVPSAIV